MHSLKNTCLLLTATINPGESVPSLKRKDASQREQDYLEAVNTWVRHELPIVFCENSNFKSELIQDVLQKSGVKFEYLCFQSEKSHLGKGHGEFEIFDHAFEHSKIIRDSTYIVKVTGRYSIVNFRQLINQFYSEKSFIYLDLKYSLSWADSRFFCFHKQFWTDYLRVNGRFIDEGNNFHFESALAKSTLIALASGHKRTSPKNIPRIFGIYGTDNVPYSNNYFVFIGKNILYKIKLFLIDHLPY